MLTAERFAGRFASYWSAVLPQLEHFVRLTNLGPRRLAPALNVSFASERQALVSETAFMLWVHGEGERGVPEGAVAAARARLAELVPAEHLTDPLSDAERAVAGTMARRLGRYVGGELELQTIEVEPRLPGCGTVSGGIPDIVAITTSRGRPLRIVLEIKSVDRTFRATDFRQLVTYAVLIFASRGYIPDLFALMNPLRGTAVEIGVAEFFADTAGTATDELVQRLVVEWSDPRLSP